MSKIYYSAQEIADMLDISKGSAYRIVKKLNEELEEQGFLVIQGKVSSIYFAERWYGGTGEGSNASKLMQGA